MILIQGIFVLVLAIIVLYLLGPKPKKPKFNFDLPKLPKNLRELDNFIRNKEKVVKNLKKAMKQK